MLRRLAMQVCAVGIGDDQAGVFRKNLAGQILREGKEQPVAMHPVVLPFLVGAQIFHRRLDLDDPDVAALVQGDQVGAPSRRQWQLADAGKAERPQQPRGTARDRERRRIEESGGLGGCPFAPNATGNIATEDLVYLLHGEGVETGIDLEALIGVATWLESTLGRELEGQVYRAGTFAPVAG